MGEFLDQPAKLSPSLMERKGNAGITPDNYQKTTPSSNHILQAAIGAEGNHPVSRLDSLDARANLFDDARHFAARRKGWRRLELIEALNNGACGW